MPFSSRGDAEARRFENEGWGHGDSPRWLPFAPKLRQDPQEDNHFDKFGTTQCQIGKGKCLPQGKCPQNLGIYSVLSPSPIIQLNTHTLWAFTLASHLLKEFEGGLHTYDVYYRYGVWSFRDQRPMTIDDFFAKDELAHVIALVCEAAANAEGYTNYSHCVEERLANIDKLPENLPLAKVNVGLQR